MSFKLKEFINNNIDKLDWSALSKNPNAINILENYLKKIDWVYLSQNPNTIHLLEQNPDKINWSNLSSNPNAIHLLEQNQDKINWIALSGNKNIYKLDCNKMKKNCDSFAEELVIYVFNPIRLNRFADKYNLTFEEIINIY